MLNNNSIIDNVTPLEFYLCQNYPNPFRHKTTIKYCVAYKTRVKLTVCDNEGREIQILVDEIKNPGTYEAEFNAITDHSGKMRNLSDVYYFYHLEAGDYSSEKKMILEK